MTTTTMMMMMIFLLHFRTIFHGMNEIQILMEMIIGNNSQFIMNSIDGTMDIVITVLDAMRGTLSTAVWLYYWAYSYRNHRKLFWYLYFFSDLEKNLNSTMVYNQDVLDAFTALIELGPNVTRDVVMAFIEPKNLLVLLPLTVHHQLQIT